MTKRLDMYFYFSLILSLCGCIVDREANSNAKNLEKGIHLVSSNHLTIKNSIGDIIKHPAFSGYGAHLLPWEDNSRYLTTALRDVGSLMPYHDNVRPEVVVDALNFMIDRVNDRQTIFYDFYSEQQKREDAMKAHTGLFFFKGKPGAPFAVVCPGGGFSYVGSLHL
jgi:hypothetical protein